MIQMNVSQARQNFLEIMNRVFSGEEFLITKNNIPVGKIVAVGAVKNKIIKKSIPKEVFGMWKNRWSKNKSSVDIINEWRKNEEERSYDR